MSPVLEHDPRAVRIRRRTAGWTIVAGLAVVAVATLVARSWRDDLPDLVATHWGRNGTADRFASPEALVWEMASLGVALVLSFGVVTALLGHSSTTRRIGAATTIWGALFSSVLMLGTLYVQRAAPETNMAGNMGWVLLLALVGPLLPAIAVGGLVPGDPRQPAIEPVDAAAPRVPLGADERAVWIGRAEAGPGIAIGIGTAVLTILPALFTQVWVLLAIPALVLALVAATFSFVVRVDRTGLVVRSALGWPRTRVPLDEVVRADVIEVHPTRDFGGWGWRVGRAGRVGIVVCAGKGLLVERSGGRSIVVTVAGAREAAGLLNALADRSR
ncbi:hypothetical protein GCM10027280_14870 [Micromonospora polyrhachis]|uniref:DUF1648 domain-containing protein n=1 Tax=Micromonospora polyrhachis TaxID=1282883 RepID=A0A7W7WP78_9ACTN|nr:DUF1648 domain-containing protein [Micromonospora polyrhachis]MBB4958625.1 hypothetical protein [Micromonospora polyrhachis]